MQITCEYCGTRIDLNNTENSRCPHCSASFENNNKVKEIKEYKRQFDQEMLEQEKIRTEEQKIKLERQKRSLRLEKNIARNNRIVKSGCLIVVVATIVFAILLFSVIPDIIKDQDFVEMVGTADTANTTTEDINAGKMYVKGEEKISVKFNEKAVSERAEVVIDRAEIYHYPYLKPPAGMVYVRVRFTITNTFTEEFTTFSNVYATYETDGVKIKADTPTISSNDLGTKLKRGSIMPGLSKQGWLYFTVPQNGEFIVHCDDNLDITIAMKNVTD